MKATDRDDQLMRAACKLAASGKCYLVLTREEIAQAAGCAPTLINHRFQTMERFRDDLMRWAVKHRELVIIAQGLSHGDRTARKAPWNVIADARECM